LPLSCLPALAPSPNLQTPNLQRKYGIDLQVQGILNSSQVLLGKEGQPIDLETYGEQLLASGACVSCASQPGRGPAGARCSICAKQCAPDKLQDREPRKRSHAFATAHLQHFLAADHHCWLPSTLLPLPLPLPTLTLQPPMPAWAC
jgi:hypothetical protein